MKTLLIVCITALLVWIFTGLVFSYFDSKKEKKRTIDERLIIETVLMYLNDKKSKLKDNLGKWQSNDCVWIADKDRMMNDEEKVSMCDSIKEELQNVERLIRNFNAIQESDK